MEERAEIHDITYKKTLLKQIIDQCDKETSPFASAVICQQSNWDISGRAKDCLCKMIKTNADICLFSGLTVE